MVQAVQSPSLPAVKSYTDEQAWEFYLGDAGAGGADWEFVVEGVRLPVHSLVLIPQSGVLSGVQADGGGVRGPTPRASAHINGHLLDHATHLEVVMSDSLALGRDEQSLAGFTLKRVAHFLRFAYWPSELAALDIQIPGAAKTLSACARLAHQLDMPTLLDRLDARMEEAVGANQATLQRLVDWCTVAEECGLRRLWTKCIRQVALALARAPSGGCTVRSMSSQDLLAKMQAASISLARAAPSDDQLAPGADAATTAVRDVALLKNMSPMGQLAVMAVLLAALRTVGEDPDALVPGEDSLAAALPAIWRMHSAPGSPAAELA
ncbi:hypothetical protein D9Q98_006794 [Chlorella vulgaris]|uniref:BTB domain-containing protein n=1 Tax=Chlorella vulgaris TaxID=3077 RepID=A0A9D4TIU4_CHLVU|nr:hypothetical protein D9Q98_006794 [Chlorella vulgaris]